MKWLVPAAVLVLAIGCGEAPANKPTAVSKAKPPAVKPAAAAAPSRPAPPPPGVAADAFADSSEAVQAFTQAAAEGNADEFRKAQSWLVLQQAKAIPAVAELVRDEQASLLARSSACKVLAELGPQAVQPLLDSSATGSPRVRQVALEQLGNVRPVDQQVVARLIELLQGTDNDIRVSAITGLFNIGPPAEDAVDALLAIANSTSEPEALRRSAKSCLKKIDPRKTFSD